MTNAEKYLKGGTDTGKLWAAFQEYYYKNKDKESDIEKASRDFLKKKATPTLTEDERVILRNIVFDSEYKYIYRSLGMLYLSENERLTCVDRLPAMHHLFQFIKERRRILYRGTVERRIKCLGKCTIEKKTISIGYIQQWLMTI